MTAADRRMIYRITTSAADWYRVSSMEQFAEGMLHAMILILIDHDAAFPTSIKSEDAIAAAAIAIGCGALAGATPSARPIPCFAPAISDGEAIWRRQ